MSKIECQKGLKPCYISFFSYLFLLFKMSSSNVQLILSELSATRADVLALKSEVSSLRAALAAKTAAAPAAAASSEKKARKTRAKNADGTKRAPNAWIVFVKRVRDLLKANGYTEQAIGVDAPMFCSAIKAECPDLAALTDADILGRRAAWTRPAVSKQAAAGKNKKSTPSGSVVSGGDGEADDLDGDAAPASTGKPKKERKNPWAGLTAEQREAKVAAMKAGRAAKKAADEGLLDDEAGGASAEEIRAAANRMRATITERPPSPKMTSVSNAAASSSSAAAASSSTAAASSSGPEGFQKIILNNKSYWVNQVTGHAYHRLKDQSQGEWAGLFSKTPKPHIDDSVPEPTGDEEDGELVIE